jgi:hypothetical protein
MQFGDTADCKSALRVRRVKNLCDNARSWEIALQSRSQKSNSIRKPGIQDFWPVVPGFPGS